MKNLAQRPAKPVGSESISHIPPVPIPILDATWQALRCVYDPELCVDIVSLGLVYGVQVEGKTIVIEMTLTTPGCPAAESLPELARSTVTQAMPEALAVDVRVLWDPPWNPAMMTKEAASFLGF